MSIKVSNCLSTYNNLIELFCVSSNPNILCGNALFYVVVIVGSIPLSFAKIKHVLNFKAFTLFIFKEFWVEMLILILHLWLLVTTPVVIGITKSEIDASLTDTEVKFQVTVFFNVIDTEIRE